MRELQLLCEYNITPWLIRQYYYCPVIPWIIVNYGVNEPPTESMIQGSMVDKNTIIGKLGFKGKPLYEVEFKSRKLPLRGRVDIILDYGRGKYVVVEVKRFKSKHTLRHKMQLLAYTLLVQENLGPVRKVILVNSEKKIEYQVTGNDIKQIVKTVNKLKEIIESEKPPTTTPNPRKCRSCWYKRYCPYT